MALKWANGQRNLKSFLEKFQKELSKKKVALFVCCGSAKPLTGGEEKTREMEKGKRKYLEDKAVHYDLNLIALGFFGGIFDFNKLSWFMRKTLSGVKLKLEEAGFTFGFEPKLLILEPYGSNSSILSGELTEDATIGDYRFMVLLGNWEETNVGATTLFIDVISK